MGESKNITEFCNTNDAMLDCKHILLYRVAMFLNNFLKLEQIFEQKRYTKVFEQVQFRTPLLL